MTDDSMSSPHADEVITFTPWRPIETAPKDGTIILLWDERASWREGCKVVVARWIIWKEGRQKAYGFWQLIDSATADEYLGNSATAPTHWMPVPHAPFFADE